MCICLYKILYWKKSQFSQSKAVKDLWVITASSIGNEKECSQAHAPFWCLSVHSVDLKATKVGKRHRLHAEVHHTGADVVSTINTSY